MCSKFHKLSLQCTLPCVYPGSAGCSGWSLGVGTSVSCDVNHSELRCGLIRQVQRVTQGEKAFRHTSLSDVAQVCCSATQAQSSCCS